MVRGLRRRRGSGPSSGQEAGELSIDVEVEVEVVRRDREEEREESGRVKQRGGPTKVAAVSGA